MRKRRIKKTYKILAFLTGIVMLVVLAMNIHVLSWQEYGVITNLAKFKYRDEVVPEIDESSLSIIMVGDALIHKTIYLDAKTSTAYDFRKMFVHVKPIIEKYDLAFYNQETILGGAELGLSTYPMFNSPYEVGDAFLDSGFNLVSLANNHTLDRGAKAIINSRKYWNSKEAMVIGSATSAEERDNIQVMEKNGIKYSLLAYTTLTNGLKSPNDYYVNVYSEERVKKDINLIKDKTDFIFVSMHWGIEYNPNVSADQKRIANYLSSLGVDVVIGHHPHVIEPIEFIGNTLVIYSLGNFISSQNGAGRLSGAMVSANLNLTTDSGTTTKAITDVEAELIYTHYKSGYNTRYGYLVYPYSMLNNSILANYQTYFKNLKERITKLDKSIVVK